MGKKKQYHHGNLKQALLTASEQLIAEMGVDALSMRRVTSHVGVSHAAVYRHFANKEELLAAIAEEGFQQLHEMMKASMGSTDPLECFMSCGRAYVHFAVAHPALFRVMFGPYIPKMENYPELARENACTYDLLQQSIVACQEAGVVCDRPLPELSLVAWTTVHGLASLLVDGQVGGCADTNLSAEMLAEQVTRALYLGMVPAP